MRHEYQIGSFRLDAEARLVTLSGAPVPLGRRAVGVLAELVRARGQCVTKSALLDAVWPGLVVEEANLSVQIAAVRRALSQIPEGERWIETLTGRGYRFIGPAEPVSQPTSQPSPREAFAARRDTLPTEVDTFVGRSDVLAALWSAFQVGARLVSLVGTGGVGKTRLAQRFGWTHRTDFPGGVWFCDLSPARSVDGIANAVARGLEVPLASADPLAQLARVIRDRGQCLVILDNFEQVAPLATQTVASWAERTPEARFLVTSRELLRIAPEVAMPVESLPTEDATALFLQRATAAEPRFTPGAHDWPAVVELATLLDGLPLAIELAAARIRVLSPRSLLERMDARFSVLPSARNRASRHATLRATFDWSWDLLEPCERSGLVHLSVFERGFTIDAAEAVIEMSSGAADATALDVLQSLVEKSLVHRRSEHRFALPETIRAYASERLATDPDCGGANIAAAVRARHGRYFANIDHVEAMAEGGAEIDNLVAACRRAVQDKDGACAVATLNRSWTVLARIGPYRTGLELAQTVESMAGLTDGQRGVLHRVMADALYVMGRGVEAKVQYERALLEGRASGEQRIEMRSLLGLAKLLGRDGHMEQAVAAGGEALAAARASNDGPMQCAALNNLGVSYARWGRLTEALEAYSEGLQLARAIGDRQNEGPLTGNLGEVQHWMGKLDEARKNYERAVQLAQETGHLAGEAVMRRNLAALAVERGELDAARSQYESTLSIGRRLGHAFGEPVSRHGLGDIHAAQGNWAAAREQYELAATLAQEAGDRGLASHSLGKLGTVLTRLGSWAEAQETFGAAESLLQDRSSPIFLAELYCRWSEAALLAQDRDAAVQRFKRAVEVAASVPTPSESLARKLDRLRGVFASERG